MRQTTLSVPLEVKPESCPRLSSLIEQLRSAEESPPLGLPEEYTRIARDVPALHFMSMSVFPARDYDPLFILEANFDGPPGPFWGQLEAALGERLREMLRCCKRPLDDDGLLYDAVTAPDSRAPVAPYFEARTQLPSVFFHGNRGMTRDRILGEAALFMAIRDELAGANPDHASPYRGTSADKVHSGMRAALLPRFSWLDEPAPARLPLDESIGDWLKLFAFAAVVLAALALPWIVLAAAIPLDRYLISLVAIMALLSLLIFSARHGLPGSETPTRFSFLSLVPRFVLLGIGTMIVYLIVVGIPVTAVILAGIAVRSAVFGWSFDLAHSWEPVARSVGHAVAWGALGAFATIGILILWLRHLERRDSSHDAPQVNERMLREMVRREDWIAQNHMGSIVLIKPGILRTIIIHIGHYGLFLVLRALPNSRGGYLGSMRTVHFAHWAFLNNHSRLLFFSNFDHSWDSYLDDFIEKAAVGLTLAWGSSTGFPPTRFLIKDGAAHGRQFKNWALASRAVSRFWYSAYKDLTVDQIERNARIAAGLRRPSLSEEKATEWLLDL